MDIKKVMNRREVRPKQLLFSVRTDMKVAALLNIVKNLDDVASVKLANMLFVMLLDRESARSSLITGMIRVQISS
jgi:hypothetical protein